jgi:hypothetical protein
LHKKRRDAAFWFNGEWGMEEKLFLIMQNN